MLFFLSVFFCRILILSLYFCIIEKIQIREYCFMRKLHGKSKKRYKQIVVFLLLCATNFNSYAQFSTKYITLKQAIEIAQTGSPQAQIAQLGYMSQYWNFRSYKAELLPSLNLRANIAEYDRSIVDVRDTETGEISYLSNNTLTNNIGISIDQNIAFTGGQISLSSDVSRLDQFSYNNKIYNTNPISLSYTQPLRSFNEFKWKKKTAPLEYENSKREYLENVENITIRTTDLFFGVLLAHNELSSRVKNYKNTKELYEVAQKRFEIGAISKNELLQLELSMLNSSLDINISRVSLDMARFTFTAYIGIPENTTLELIPPVETPDLSLDYEFVFTKAFTNSSHSTRQDIKRLDAEMEVAEAKALKGLQASLNANLGLSQSDNTFRGAFRELKDREIVGVSLSLPIYDWGMSRGRVNMARAREKLAKTEIEQEETTFSQDIKIKVMQFNNQIKQCEISGRAQDIANERYRITIERFKNGSLSVTELNTAQKEKDDAVGQYIEQLSTYWVSYYELQKLTLYDFMNKRDISVEFDELVEK